jgi:secretion/DNA translocation related TadE-like protein
MVAVLLCVTAGGAYLGAVVVARHRAQSAADLAAVAAAAWLPAGADGACARATTVAHRMRADATGCAVDDLDVVVTVDMAIVFGGWGNAHAAARAGPGD